MKSLNLIISFIIVSLLFIACKKPAGEGGTSAISGKVYIKNYNKSGQLIEEYYAPDERVYIIYGDEIIYGDDMRTHYDGSYQFEDLRKGSYKVYAYSDDTTGNVASGTEPVIVEVEITENKEVVTVKDIIVLR